MFPLVPMLILIGKCDDSSGYSLRESLKPNHHVISRFRRVSNLILIFVLGQGALQGINVVIGLFLLRVLSVSDYAKFGLATGFQATASILIDLGCASTIVSLIGERALDPAMVGRYVRGAKSLRDTTFWVLSPIAAVIFLIITHRQEWSWPTQAILLLTILVGVYSNGSVSYYSAPLFLHRRLSDFYLPQTISNLCRLAAYAILGLLGSLNFWTTASLSALNLAISGRLVGEKSRKYMAWPRSSDQATQKEIRRYVLPASPAIILAAFQGQVALILISIFGNTVSIAEVAALGRLGLLFSVLMTFNVAVIEPYIARLSSDRLLSVYVKLMAFAAIGCIALAAFSFVAPGCFLLLLGPKYSELRGLIGWVIMTACINYMAGLLWIMNRSRKWVFWRGAVSQIFLLLVVQIGFVAVFGIRNTREAVMFNFISSFCYLIPHAYIAIYGFLKAKKEASSTTASLSLIEEGHLTGAF
jgi:O-antigen/teichoic acid export membrane protein